MSRPLEANEHDLLVTVLDAGTFEGAAELRAQIPEVMVLSGPPTFLNFEVGSKAPIAVRSDGPIPVRTFVRSDAGEPLGEILVWVAAGRLSALEFAWVTDEAPAALPAPDALHFDTR